MWYDLWVTGRPWRRSPEWERQSAARVDVWSLQRWGKAEDLAAMSMMWCNGEWIDADDFAVSPRDRGLLHGFGLFETLLAVDGVTPFAGRHLARMVAGAGRLGWELDGKALLDAIPDLLARNDLLGGLARVRVSMTAGSGALDDAEQGLDRRLWMTASPVERWSRPLQVMVSPWRRNERSPLAGIKCASYAENLVALQQARRAGCDEVLFFNTQEHLCEAAMANVFLVRDGGLSTPSLESGCLPGVTRALVIEMAAANGIDCREAVLVADELQAADEVFLTSSVQGVRPVARMDGRELSTDDLTERLMEAWQQAVGLV